jgi:hypothetical protein
VNHAAGRGNSRDGIHLDLISKIAGPAMARVRNILGLVVESDVS